MNKNLMNNENKGFSLVELIVVIAIMAVLTSVLAPSLLGYVEKSRMQKDDSAMGEVANAIQLALADQNVYDECLAYNVADNYSCYADSGVTEENKLSKMVNDKCKTSTHQHTGDSPAAPNADSDLWHYNDTARMKDEEAYGPAGNMRGLTISFNADSASNTAVFKMGTAKVNEMSTKGAEATKEKAGASEKKGTGHTTTITMAEMTTANGQPGQLYNKLRAVIGDSITLSSQTYRNSEYTVFIRMGSLGGNDASAQDAIAVYGQWNGTNLIKD